MKATKRVLLAPTDLQEDVYSAIKIEITLAFLKFLKIPLKKKNQ